jgi:hypothetical protein
MPLTPEGLNENEQGYSDDEEHGQDAAGVTSSGARRKRQAGQRCRRICHSYSEHGAGLSYQPIIAGIHPRKLLGLREPFCRRRPDVGGRFLSEDSLV